MAQVSKALPGDAHHIVDLSTQVQKSLTASGSLQQIGPLKPGNVRQATTEERCYILKDPLQPQSLLGCAFAKPMTLDFIATEYEGQPLDIETYCKPWIYLHSIMLKPDIQGKGLGKTLVHAVMECLRKDGEHGVGTVFLDCWAGNEKLKEFYQKCGFEWLRDVWKEREGGFSVSLFCKALYSLS